MTKDQIFLFFDQLKKISKNSKNRFTDEIEDDLQSCLAWIGKKRFYELEKLIWPFLNYPSRHIREESIRALNSLSPDEFKERAYQIWHDLSRTDLERIYALEGWYSFYSNTKEPTVLKLLYTILIDEVNTPMFRAEALSGIVEVCDDWKDRKELLDISKLGDTQSSEVFFASVDWSRVQSLMQKYAPGILQQ